MSRYEGSDPYEDRPTVLSAEQAAHLEQWCRAAADQMGLHEWRVMVSPHEADENATASSRIREYTNEVWIAVEREWALSPERRQRTTLTHELVHCIVQRHAQMIEDIYADTLGAQARAVAASAIFGAAELMVDQLAWVISEHLPPIE